MAAAEVGIVVITPPQCRTRFHAACFKLSLPFPDVSAAGSVVENLPAMQEMQVPSLGWKDPLEKEMATHSYILAWEIVWTEEPGGLQS